MVMRFLGNDLNDWFGIMLVVFFALVLLRIAGNAARRVGGPQVDAFVDRAELATGLNW